MSVTPEYMHDRAVIERVLSHVRNGTTDEGGEVWREPVDHDRSEERLRRDRNGSEPVAGLVAADPPQRERA